MGIKNKKLYVITFIVIVVLSLGVNSKKSGDDEEKPTWTKKKITDYSDADMERLLDQWNVRIIYHIIS